MRNGFQKKLTGGGSWIRFLLFRFGSSTARVDRGQEVFTAPGEAAGRKCSPPRGKPQAGSVHRPGGSRGQEVFTAPGEAAGRKLPQPGRIAGGKFPPARKKRADSYRRPEDSVRSNQEHCRQRRSRKGVSAGFKADCEAAVLQKAAFRIVTVFPPPERIRTSVLRAG